MHASIDRACDMCDHHTYITAQVCEIPCFVTIGFARASGCVTPLTGTTKRAAAAQVRGHRTGVAHMGYTHASQCPTSTAHIFGARPKINKGHIYSQQDRCIPCGPLDNNVLEPAGGGVGGWQLSQLLLLMLSYCSTELLVRSW